MKNARVRASLQAALTLAICFVKKKWGKLHCRHEGKRKAPAFVAKAGAQTVDKVVNGLFKWKKQEKGKATSNK